MTAYYNEFDPHAAQWLRNLIAAGHIAPGDVDERSIEDVTPNDLRGYTQCHFFAGIGGWSLAARLAGWPDSRELWTGSCPCQPFSAAGKSNGFDDERHLWPAFQWLIAQRRPTVIFGEQVASKAVDAWIDLVHADMESMGYAFGSIPFPAAGVGAPHIRDRNYWTGHANGAGLEGHTGHGGAAGRQGSRGSVAQAGLFGGMADSEHDGRDRPQGIASQQNCDESNERLSDGNCATGGRPGPTNGHWRVADWLGCRDGKWRPVEPGTFPLAHGVSGRVGLLRGYGNAIVPQAAAEFIGAYLDGEA